jgi:hypothetical protein
MVEVRPFARHDREQLTALVNAHIAAATPGGSIPTATLLNQLEHPLGEYIIGPWVTDLATFVAVERDRVVWLFGTPTAVSPRLAPTGCPTRGHTCNSSTRRPASIPVAVR